MATPSPSGLRQLLIDEVGRLLGEHGVEGEKRVHWLMSSSRDLSWRECSFPDASPGTVPRRICSGMHADLFAVPGHHEWVRVHALWLLYSSILNAPRGYHSVVCDLTVGPRLDIYKIAIDAWYYTGPSGRAVDTLCCVDPSTALQICLLRRGVPSHVGLSDESGHIRLYLLVCRWSTHELKTALDASEQLETIADHIAHWVLARRLASITLWVDGVQVIVGEKKFVPFYAQTESDADSFASLESNGVTADMHTLRSGFAWQCNQAFSTFSTHPDTAVLPRDIVSLVRQYVFEGGESFTE